MRLNVSYPIDLHLHSAHSDGLLSPPELCEKANRLRLRCIALCDHDTVSGLSEMQEAVERANRAREARGGDPPLALIGSIELSSGKGGRVHVLGYGVNANHPALARMLREAGEDRERRAALILNRLRQQGVELPGEALEKLRGQSIGRAHIARALVQAGAVSDMQQAFARYLGEGKSAYVPRKPLDTRDAIRILREAGATPVLAHPYRLPVDEPALYMLIREYLDYGLMGVEAYHPSATRAQAQSLESFARRSGLLVTGGSDFHGDAGSRVQMARMPGGWSRALDDAEALILSF